MANPSTWLLAGALLLANTTVHAAGCDDQAAVWATPERDGVRHLLYGTGAITVWSGIFIEEWRNGRRAWRTKAGWATCSNGQVTCIVYFDDETMSDGGVAAIIEQIDDDGDGRSEYIVLAGLLQDLYYGGGAAVDWDDGFEPLRSEELGYERAYPSSNVFRFFDCRRDPIALDTSTVFAARPVYSKYQASGSLEPDDTFPKNPGSVWWMTGEVIKGADLNCAVKSFNRDETVTAACRKTPLDPAQPKNLSFRYEGDFVLLDGQRLDMFRD
jgi:hypothetical protein